MKQSRINTTVRNHLMRNRMERAEESERQLLELIQLFASGSKVAGAYLKKLGLMMEVQKL